MTIQPVKKSRLATPAIVVAASAASVMLGIGLCNVGHFNLEGSSSPTADSGVLFFFAGVFGVVVGILWLIVAAIMGARTE